MILSILNQKGGVGKTTTAHNLAVGLALRGYRVLGVDADQQRSWTNAYPAMPQSLFDVLAGTTEIKPAAVEVRPNLFLLGSDSRLADAGPLWRKLSAALKRSDYDVTVIDSPANWHSDARAVALASNCHIIVINAGIQALESGIETQHKIEALPGSKSHLLGYLLTCRNSTQASRLVESQEVPWLDTTIPDSQARIKGLELQSKSVFDSTGPVRKAYENLTTEIIKRCSNQLPERPATA